MHCDTLNKYLNSQISDDAYFKHVSTCPSCAELLQKTNSTLSILDNSSDVPVDLAKNILIRKSEMLESRSSRFDLSMILQFASVIIFGVFLGIFLGRNSDTKLLKTKNSDRTESLIEYKQSHYLFVDHEIF